MNPDLAGGNGVTVSNFLMDVFGDDRDVIEYVQRFPGYHHTSKQCRVAFDSSGSNGKSSLVGLLDKLCQ